MASSALIESFPINQPYHTSILTGEGWVQELLAGHPERICCELGVSCEVFLDLLKHLYLAGYSNSKHLSLKEQVAISLYICVTGLSIRHVGERFQRSNESISCYFRKILSIFSSCPFYSTLVHLPTARDPVPCQIRTNPKFWPFFKNCLGTLDGTHIWCSPPAYEWSAYRNRKGFVSQNCLLACSFDFTFVYSLTGWEGSATDARIYGAARSSDLHIPEGKYYLADAGYPLSTKLLVPYRGIRYHLAKWGRTSVRPANKEELFNLRHASVCNVIERIFGVLKKRFRILHLPPEYSVDVQARIPAALCAIHNFIVKHNLVLLPEDAPRDYDDHYDHVYFVGAEPEDAHSHRDHIALRMWESYQAICAERTEAAYESLDDDDDDDVDND